ncbi:Flp family type IVb pilin, partial [Acinetobacter baumannii]
GEGRTGPTAIECGGGRAGLARLAAGLRGLLADRAGATAIEYGIIAVLVAVGIMTAVQSIGDTENESFTTLSTGLSTDPPLSVPPFANK